MTNNIQGNFIPGTTTTDICNSQYILNWLATGGDQKDTSSNGTNNVVSIFGSDTSYNIQDNKISFYFTDPCNNNISIRDAQYLINWNEASGNSFNRILGGNSSIKYSVYDYTYPKSEDIISLVTYEDCSFGTGDISNICINRLYLKQKNSSTTQNIVNKHILANCIPYLKLNKGDGYMLKRYDNINASGAIIEIYASGYDSSGNIREKIMVGISSENLSGIDISRNTNNIFEPVKKFDDQVFVSKGYFPDVVEVTNFNIPGETGKYPYETINDISNQIRSQPWFNVSSSIAIEYAKNNNKEFVYVYKYHDTQVPWSTVYYDENSDEWISRRESYNNSYAYVSGGSDVSNKPRRFAKAILNPKIINSYSYIGIGDARPYKNNINYTTTYNNIYGQSIEIPNWGVQSVDVSSNILDNRLTGLDTLQTTTSNMLNINRLGVSNIIDFNKKSWFLAGRPINSTQGHFVGQFVFTKDAMGSMIYQYYYSPDVNDDPYTIYFNISGGRLEFPGSYPIDYTGNTDELIKLFEFMMLYRSMNIRISVSSHYIPWITSPSDNGVLAGIVANIYKQNGLRFIYYYNIEKEKIFYKEWNNFKVIDSSCVYGDDSWDASWAALIVGKTSIMEDTLYSNIINTFLIQPVDLSHSMYISKLYIGSNITDSPYVYHDIPYDKTYVNTIILGSDTTTISNKMFEEYSALEHIIFNENLTNIDASNIFNNLSNLKQVTIPKNVSTINSDAFANCPGLKTLIFLGNYNKYSHLNFNNSTDLSNIFYIPGNNTWTSDISIGGIYPKPIPYNDNVFEPSN